MQHHSHGMAGPDFKDRAMGPQSVHSLPKEFLFIICSVFVWQVSREVYGQFSLLAYCSCQGLVSGRVQRDLKTTLSTPGRESQPLSFNMNGLSWVASPALRAKGGPQTISYLEKCVLWKERKYLIFM